MKDDLVSSALLHWQRSFKIYGTSIISDPVLFFVLSLNIVFIKALSSKMSVLMTDVFSITAECA